MTICIAAIAGEHVVVTSDRMVTWGYPSTEFEQNVPKMINITDNCVALTAGNALGFGPIYNEAIKIIQEEDIKNINNIVKIILNEYTNVRKTKIEQEILSAIGLTWGTFYQLNRSLESSIIQNTTHAIQRYNYGLSIVIAGVDDDGSHIYTITNPGKTELYDNIGHCSIGSGDIHATSTFITNDYDPKLDLNHIVAMTYEAKRKSEKAQGVGEETDLYIINKNKTKKLPKEKMDELDNIVSKKSNQEKEHMNRLEKLIKNLNIK